MTGAGTTATQAAHWTPQRQLVRIGPVAGEVEALVALTEAGDVLANVTLVGGQVRPAVWRTG